MTIPPLLILLIGIVTVIGMIIWLRINAFISLITAAIVVSLLSGGAIGSKITRVAEAFGVGAGKIGIVIALAAVIGKCMMDSGAADRVVRAFLRLLGEKRASFALMGSGFVLAVPVFFDTVFYLLVPLARSLYRRTGRNYLMYILAIAAGGAITHTLVPPTPGPLVMAANLGIDLGYMILVGALVALPAALAGIAFSVFADRAMDVPMRQVGSEPDPLADEELPGLFVSLLPVILPVLMISTNTVLSTMADAEAPQQITVSDISDYDAFRDRLVNAESPSPGARLLRFLPEETRQQLEASAPQTAEEKQQVVDGLNIALTRRIDGEILYDNRAFESVVLPAWKLEEQLNSTSDNVSAAERELARRQQQLVPWIDRDRTQFRKNELERFHRIALEAAFPTIITVHQWDTPIREAANVSSLLGDANLALLVSTAIAMIVLWKQRRPTLTQMAGVVEESLMSGGAIILITAAGYSFGQMLKVAEVGNAIQAMFSGSAGGGMFYLFMGFGLAALLKVAQGSSTTAMIVGSSMLAPTIAGIDLGYHPVYLATAIGAGSLIGSWMNDSGFWIFAKMGGLTEVEALKSWTPLLIVLGATSMAMTVLLAIVLPLV